MRKLAGGCCGCAAIVAVVVFCGVSEARIPRGGNVVGLNGVLYNTNSPEWRASGGNIMVYQQIMQQKMMIRQQQYMMKQQQAAQKLQKQQQGKGKAAGLSGAGLNGGAPFVSDFGRSKVKKKKRTYDPSRPVGSQLKNTVQKNPTENNAP